MKRLAVILLVVAALASSIVVLTRPGAQASPDVTITVNSPDDTVDPEAVLTLREAIMLATGGLALGDLTQSECYQVWNTTWLFGTCSISVPPGPPGADSTDTIVFDADVFRPGSPATITLGSALPELSTGDDTVDGSSAGVVVDGGGASRALDCFDITSDNNVIKGLEIQNCRYSVRIRNGAQNNTVGGTSPGEGNVISSWHVDVSIEGSGTNGNSVKGNDLRMGEGCLDIRDGAENNTIGGSGPGEGNVMGACGEGVLIAGADGNRVQGNYIGTDASGTAALPNLTGVAVVFGCHNNTIGGSSPGEGNVIAFNQEYGVKVDGYGAEATGNTISGNSIHSNGEKGIENEHGGNTELAPPIVDSAVGSASGHTDPKCYPCTVEVFSDDEDEGRIYHGSTTTNNDATGTWSYPGEVTGPNVTATITDADGNTSEFSVPVEVTEETPTPSPTPTPTPTPSPTPTPTPGATPTPTPPAGPTRALVWGPGWHNETWSGASTPAEAFACAVGKYAAAYRFTDSGLERYFPARPDISNMSPLAQYDAFLILVTQPVSCTMPVAAASGTTRALQWGVGWHNEGWSGPDGTTPENAFACADGNYAAAYRFTEAGLERYFPNRPDISNMGPLDKYDAFLILVTAPVSCAMPIAP